jgi:hypothetical protein
MLVAVDSCKCLLCAANTADSSPNLVDNREPHADTTSAYIYSGNHGRKTGNGRLDRN